MSTSSRLLTHHIPDDGTRYTRPSLATDLWLSLTRPRPHAADVCREHMPLSCSLDTDVCFR